MVDFMSLGPSVGEAFPGFRLFASDGTPFDLHADRAGRPALVLFHRSARW